MTVLSVRNAELPQTAASAALEGRPRLWLGSQTERNRVVLFRRRFDLASAPRQAGLHLFADSRFRLFVNGQHVGRGPAASHPHRLPVSTFDVAPYLRQGNNVIAVAVLHHGIALHHYVPSGKPGLVASLRIQEHDGSAREIVTDANWVCTDRSGWLTDAPRRSWAIGCVEHFDARLAPVGWTDLGFDDSDWQQADVHEPLDQGEVRYQDPCLPALRHEFQPAKQLIGVWGAPARAVTVNSAMREREFAKNIIEDEWRAPARTSVTGSLDDQGGGIAIENLGPDEGARLAFDLGAEFIGSVTFEIETDSEGVIDIGWSEYAQDGRPWICQYGSSYVDRYLARQGAQTWLPLHFNAGRYVYLGLHGFTGSARIRRIGMLASEPDLAWRGSFRCEDERVNAIYDLCARTVRVGVQETMMDCPSREQALYVGDGIPNGLWIGRQTGDYSHVAYLLREALSVLSTDGVAKSSVFSGRTDGLLDYSLLAAWGVNEYVRETGDLELAREFLPACRRILAYFLARRNEIGLYDEDWEFLKRDGNWVQAPATAADVVKTFGHNIFIDHPGMGWHNKGEPGIDRRGLNAAMNALLVMTLKNVAAVEDRTGDWGGTDLRATADAIALAADRVFWNDAEGAYADGVRGGELLPQISQQTNAWMLLSGVCPPERRERVLDTILDDSRADMARCGPYFWSYLFPVLTGSNRLPSAIEQMKALWSRMVERGATTTWETFRGDECDSYCHPWSSAPADFLPRHVAGVGPLPTEAQDLHLTPRIDLFRQVKAAVMTMRGEVQIEWTTDGQNTLLQGVLPEGVRGVLHLPGGATLNVHGRWEHRHG